MGLSSLTGSSVRLLFHDRSSHWREQNPVHHFWDLTGSGYELYYVAWKFNSNFRYSGVEDDQSSGGPHNIDNQAVNALSHVSFYGRPGGSVPEGGDTLALLGVAMVGLGALRRFVKP